MFETAQVRSRLDKLKEGTKEHEDAMSARDAVQTCQDMQLSNLAALAVPDLTSRYNNILSHGVDFPLVHHQHLTKYILSHFLDMGQSTTWS